MRSSSVEELKPKALEFLRGATLKVGVGDVAKELGVSWATARQVLMELVIDGKVDCERTSISESSGGNPWREASMKAEGRERRAGPNGVKGFDPEVWERLPLWVRELLTILDQAARRQEPKSVSQCPHETRKGFHPPA